LRCFAKILLHKFSQKTTCNCYSFKAVVGAWAEDIGLDSETAYKIASGFGGGIGRMREVCGAFTGAVIDKTNLLTNVH